MRKANWLVRAAKRKSSFTVNLRCPDDGHLLHPHAGLVPFASCRHCDGLWFSNESIESRGAAKLPETRKGARKARPPRGSRSCPQCLVRLDPLDVGETTIDECAKCGGVWLDAGEYKAASRARMERRLDRYAPSMRPIKSKLGKGIDRVVERIEQVVELLQKDMEEPPPRVSIPKKPRRPTK